MADREVQLAEELRIEQALTGMSGYLQRKSMSFGESMSMQEDVIRQLSSLSQFAGPSSQRALPGTKDTQQSNVAVAPAVSAGSPDPFSDNFDLVTYIKHKNSLGAPHGLSGPDVTITFEDLEIFGDRLEKKHIRTFLNRLPFVPTSAPVAQELEGEKNRRLIAPCSGYFKPGEMTLVLGRPGAGCSTFLREIAGVSRGLSEVRGSVQYNGVSQKEFRAKYPSLVVYNPEDDAHYPILTVRETLRFALSCRIPAGSPAENKTRDQVIEERLEVILKMLGLGKCADTKVGDEVVRGCSGGERKRVSLAEQWCMGASVGVWDGSTKGLDSSTALDFVRALRVMTDLTHTSQIVSIYQASEDIYDLFDNVLLVADSRVIYFGPAKEAPLDFFKSLGLIPRPRATTPDFLTGLLDPAERCVDPNFPADKVPDTAEAIEAHYRMSPIHKEIMDKLAVLKESKASPAAAQKFRDSVAALKVKEGVPKHAAKGPYFTTWAQQFACTATREVILAKRDIATAAILLFDTVMAIIAGLIFLNVQDTPSGHGARAGVLFFAIVYMCFNCIASVPLIIKGRGVSGKHKTFRLYRTELQTFATQLTNAPAIFLLAITYACGNYWIVGLYASAAAFFTFIFTTFLTNQAFGSIVRLVAILMPDLSTAMVANACYFLISTMSMGYLLPFGLMRKWFKVFFWANPLQYGLRALYQNEFLNIPIYCEGENMVPYIPSDPSDPLHAIYDNLAPENFACKMVGSTAGSPFVSGSTYIEKLYGFDKYNLYWNWLILLAYIIMAYAGLIITAKYFGALPSEYSINVWKKKHFRSKHSIAIQQERQAAIHEIAAGRAIPVSHVEDFSFAPVQTSFTWKHIDYTVRLPSGEDRQLLCDVQGYVKSGEMVALMGSSGAGKTTLIDCLTQRKTVGQLTGQIYVRTRPQGKDFKTMTAYCEQMDVHNPYSTVKETIRFAARLRQSATIPVSRKINYADYVMHLLELDDVADAVVGKKGMREGISLEQQKRLTIACELAAKPEILFLDEPTSGLDSQAAFTIVRLLRKLADMGQAVLCTIHQPSAVVFAHFDKVLLLARGGSTVYFGPLGENCSSMINYFTSLGADNCLEEENPAEWMLNVIGAGITTNEEATFKRTELGELMTTQWWVKQWAKGEHNAIQGKEIDSLRGCEDKDATAIAGVGQFTPAFACGLPEQLAVVGKRMLISYYRNPEYNFGRVLNLIWAGLWIGFAYFDSPMTAQGVENKTFSVFIILTIGALQSKLAQPNYHELRSVFVRERATGVYDWKAFAASVSLAEIPFLLVTSLVFFCCYYWAIGFSREWNRFGYFFLMYTMYCISCVSWGQAIISLFPTVQLAAAINPFSKAMQLLTAGIAVPYPSLPGFFHWIYWMNPFHYFVESAIANEVGHREILCDTEFGFPFVPPTGLTCGEYMAPYMAASGDVGRLADTEATDLCHYCPYATGDAMLIGHYGNWSYNHRWRNFGLFFAFWAFNIIVIFCLVKIYKVGR